jgi:aromatic-L-amino-acid decarboxylase
MWQGVEEADSLVFNAHKWLGVAFDCSVYYVRDPQHLVRVMSTNPSYLRTAADAGSEPARSAFPTKLPGKRFRYASRALPACRHGCAATSPT